MIDFFREMIMTFADFLIDVLPTSPFQPYIAQFANLPYLSYLNWFIPIKACIKIGTTWLLAIALFYLYGIIMRWVKLIGD